MGDALLDCIVTSMDHGNQIQASQSIDPDLIGEIFTNDNKGVPIQNHDTTRLYFNNPCYVLDLFFRYGILRGDALCAGCGSVYATRRPIYDANGRPLRMTREEMTSDHIMFRCTNWNECEENSDHSIFNGTALHGMSKPVNEVFQFFCLFLSGASPSEIGRHLNWSKNTVTKYSRFCRLVMQQEVVLAGRKLGGVDEDGTRRIVEIDESHFRGKRKYHRGTAGGSYDIWIFGMVCRSTLPFEQKKRVRLFYVPDRTRRTLIGVLANNVLAGTHVMSDQFTSYINMPSQPEMDGMHIHHTTVNHSLHFYDAVTGTCTNGIEGEFTS